jgi:hypothetical protein
MAIILSIIGDKNVILGREKLADAVTDKKWRDMNDKSLFNIQLCLNNSTLQEICLEKPAKDL